MREILFRGKRLDNGEWVEGAFCPKNCDMPFGPMVDKPSIIKLDDPYSGFWFDVAGDTVGQFTGLLDKNGKRIFEGDVVVIQSGAVFEMAGRVVFEDGAFQVVDPDEIYECLWYKLHEMEVIGNVYDNPELLQGGQYE